MKRIVFLMVFMIFAFSCSESKKIVTSDNEGNTDNDIVVTDDVQSDSATDESVNDQEENDTSQPDTVTDNETQDELTDNEVQDEVTDETADETTDETQDVIPDEDSEVPDFDTFGMCQENGECGVKDFCQKSTGDCDGYGDCEEMPVGCAEMYAPVCGCDEKTYSNECSANAEGMNVDYDGECVSTVTYSYADSGMPPFFVEGELIINEGGTKHIFDLPQYVNRTKSTIEVIFETKDSGIITNTVVFTFSLSEFPKQECTELNPCKITLGKGDSGAVWKVSSGGGGYLNGELTGVVYITENTDEEMSDVFEFHSEELVFQPFG